MDNFVLEQAEKKLRATYPAYNGYVKRGDVVEFIGVTEEDAAAVISDIEFRLDELTLDATKTELLTKLDAAYKTRFETTAPDWRELKYWMKNTNLERYATGEYVEDIDAEAAAFAEVASNPNNTFDGTQDFIDPATGGPKTYTLTHYDGLAEIQLAKSTLWLTEFAQLEASYEKAQTTIKYAVSIEVAQAAYEAFATKWN